MFQSLRKLEPRQQAALALGSLLLVADMLLLATTGDFNVALGGVGVSIFGLAFTLPRDERSNGTKGT